MTKSSPAILALDTAGNSCSAALWRDGNIAAEAYEAMPRGQSERLLPMIQGVLATAALGFEDLDGLAVTVGPGAFTGVRIGLAAARGLALAQGLPLLGVTSFDVVASTVTEEAQSGRRLVVALDAKRADLYVQAYGKGAPPATALLPEALDEFLPVGALLLAGSGSDQARPALEASGRDVASWPNTASPAVALAHLAGNRSLPGAGESGTPATTVG